jgi:DNA-binding PadR family transcriptional regulator
MKESAAEFVILGLLSYTSMTGYDINKAVKTRMSSFWDIGYGQIYPTLRMLEKDGYVTKKVEIKENGPNRKVYSVTNKGTKKLQKWLMKPAKPEIFKFEALLKIAFGEQVPKHEIIKHIEELRARTAEKLENLICIEKEVNAHLNEDEGYFFGILPVLLGINIYKSSIEWADAAIKMIEERKQKEENAR